MSGAKKKILLILLILFVLGGGASAYIFLQQPPLPQRLRNSCLQIMGRGDCSIMQNAKFLPAETQQIFISGFGNLNARTYRQLQSQGLNMCNTIREACEEDEHSEICRYGKAVY